GADHGVQYNIGAGQARGLHQGIRPEAPVLGNVPALFHETPERCAAGPARLSQKLRVRVRRESRDVEARWMAGEDTQGRGPDGARRTENCDALTHTGWRRADGGFRRRSTNSNVCGLLISALPVAVDSG